MLKTIKSLAISSVLISAAYFSNAAIAKGFQEVSVACFPVSSGFPWIEEATSQSDFNYLVSKCKAQGGQVTIY